MADYHFDHSPPDVELLGELMQICAASHTPMMTGVAPGVIERRLGDLLVVVLTQVIGRGIGLVGRGIVQGMGRSISRG